MIKFKPTPITRISFGLVLLTLSVLIAANWIGLTPNTTQTVLDARKKVAETLAIQLSKLAEKNELGIIKSVVHSVKERNKDIVSIALRLADGQALVELGDRASLDTFRNDNKSTPTHILIPIYAANKQWGRVEINFLPLGKTGFLDSPFSPLALLLIFITVAGYFLYHLFLRRALRYLDPTAVIPDRVKTAMDILAEGVMILNEQEHVVLTNRAFSDKVGADQTDLLGKNPAALPWHFPIETIANKDMPWSLALKTAKSQMAVALNLHTTHNGLRTFMVNSAPILDNKGKPQGVLTTFDDVTQLEERNTQLSSMLERLEKSQQEVQDKNRELVILATQDALTGCLNRRAFFDILQDSMQKALNGGEDIACIMMDIDFFKSVNDHYGHGVGDQVIRAVADTLRASLRDNDKVCRYGGEEFCVLLKGIKSAQAGQFAERIRRDIEHLRFDDDPATEDLRISSSFGVSDSTLNAKNPTELVNQADYALYGAKEAGRNQVKLWSSMLAKKAEGQKSTDSQTNDEKSDTRKQSSPNQPQDNRAIPNNADNLTGLPGRKLFLNMIHKAIQEHSGTDNIAVMFIDIDAFKRINNLLGFDIGDQLLREKSQRLMDILRSTDELTRLDDGTTVSRISGDEFGVLMHNLPSLNRTRGIASRIIQSLAKPYNIEQHAVYATCSIGISVFPQDGTDADTLLQHAETAMSCAKKMNGNNYQFYSRALDTESIEELQLENNLRSALSNNELDIFYQPKVDVATNTIVGMEALIRWHHPSKGLILPSVFLSLAEKTGIIHEIGLWVFSRACEQAKAWHDLGFNDFSVAVNISATQFAREGFLEQVTMIINNSGVDPQHIEIEVTEHTMLHNIETVSTIVEQLREIGVRASLDDFGTGYSSLHYIKRFPVDALKIDISFIQNICTDTDDIAIVSAIITMAHAMNLKVIAEGVENSEQLQILRELGCDQVQGYIFSRAKPSDEATALLHSQYHSEIRQPFANTPLATN